MSERTMKKKLHNNNKNKNEICHSFWPFRSFVRSNWLSFAFTMCAPDCRAQHTLSLCNSKISVLRCFFLCFIVADVNVCVCVCVFSSLSFLTKSVNTSMALDSSTMQLPRLIEITQRSSAYQSIVSLFLASKCVLIHFKLKFLTCKRMTVNSSNFVSHNYKENAFSSLTFLQPKTTF